MHPRLLVCLFAFASTLAGSQQPSSGAAPGRVITVGVVHSGDSSRSSSTASSSSGVTLGIEEAERTARLFGWRVRTLEAPDSLSPADAVRFVTDRGATAIVGNLTGPLQNRTRGVPLLIDIVRAQRPPSTDCANGEFHLLPRSASLAWSPSLQRFGAEQLNERYQKRFDREMDEQAWAGWMAVKIVVDAVLKKETTDACTLERYLITDARFDGHKGVPLFFDPQTRELVQPLFEARASGEPATVENRRAPGTAAQPRGANASPCPVVCR